VNRSFFDPPVASTAPALTPEVKTASPSQYGKDVLRVIEHCVGPFKWLAGDVGERPHVIVQLTSGAYVMRYLDGTEIGPLTNFSPEDVENNLEQRRWKVVQG
jgi:hypothetical protein